MDANRFQAMIVAYFLSRDDARAYDALGYGTQLATHDAVAARFDVKRNTVKNWRDEFDAVHDNSRQGWYQRPQRPSRARLAERYRDLSFDALLALVQRLLRFPSSGPDLEVSAEILVPDSVDGDEDETDEAADEASAVGTASARAVTGRAAEEAFAAFHAATATPVPGRLIDQRTSAEGYDFEIKTEGESCFVEVKGLAGSSGTVTLTAREWASAKKYQERYFLALVLEAGSAPRIVFVRNPSASLSPNLRLVQVIQEQWQLSASAIIALAP